MLLKKSAILLLLAFGIGVPASFAQDKPFELGVEQKNYLPNEQPPPQEYGKPMMIGPPPVTDKATPPPKKDKKIKAKIEQSAPPPPVQQPPPQQQQMMQPMQGVLPPQFLGRWQVLGNRSGVEAQPQYQAGMDSIFSMTTSNIWNIQGNPERGYMLSTDTGVSTPLMVQTQGNTAILRYQHPIRNTVAQEALVMQLGPNGAQFEGLERISIVKQGEPGPRAKVTYKLLGRRQ